MEEQKMSKNRKYGDILGVNIDSASEDRLLSKVENYLSTKKQFFIVTPNPEIVLTAQSDEKLRKVLNNADISLPDGTGLIFAAKLLKQPLKSRLPGRKFMLSLFKLANEKHLQVYLLGGSRAVISQSVKKLNTQYPRLKVEGMEGPKLDTNGEALNEEEKEIENTCIKNINASTPDILFIAFGAPKQEKWFNLHKKELKVGGAMVVGGALNIFSGYKKGSPAFLDKLGLEWVWRLIQEPQRIGRIVNATIIFPVLVIKERLHMLSSR